MKILIRPTINISNLPVARSLEEKAAQLLCDIDEEMVREYHLEEALRREGFHSGGLPGMSRLEIIKSDLRFQLMPFLYIFKSSVSGKKIVDLGCGSPQNHESSSPRYFEPWLCRVLAHLEADVTGVDLYPAPHEKYRHLQRDLTQPGSLADIEKGTVDIVNTTAFFDAPSLISTILPKDLIHLIRDDIAGILTEDGVLMCDTSVCHDFQGVHIPFPPRSD